MSGLDRAFIKAYTKQHQPARAVSASHISHARPAASRAHKPAVGVMAREVQRTGTAAQPWSAPRSPEETPATPSYVIFDDAHATIPAPHWAAAPSGATGPGIATTAE